MKRFSPAQQDDATGFWRFKWETSGEDPSGDLLRLNLRMSEAAVSSTWGPIRQRAGYAYLTISSDQPKEFLERCQNELKNMGWTAAEPDETDTAMRGGA